MRVKSLHLKDFKRFSNLVIDKIPETAKLVLLVGPNGSGKTSVFEAMNLWLKYQAFNYTGDNKYYEKNLDGFCREDENIYHATQKNVRITFHNETIENKPAKERFYFRSAYRNESDFDVRQLNKQDDPTQTIRLKTLMQNDQVVSENYQRLIEISQALLDCEENDPVKILGYTDAMKVKSCMTLFLQVEPDNVTFRGVIDKFYGGQLDDLMLSLVTEGIKETCG